MRKSLLVLFCAISAFALAACGGGGNKNSSSSSTTTSQSSLGKPNATSPMPMAKVTPKNPKLGKPEATGMTVAASSAAGQKIFMANCSSCHQANGKGQPGVFPPLAGNATVTGDASKVIHIVKNGLNGKITVNGSTYNGQMPAWKGTLSNADIANVVSYIRSAWGNKASAVTAAQVASAP